MGQVITSKQAKSRHIGHDLSLLKGANINLILSADSSDEFGLRRLTLQETFTRIQGTAYLIDSIYKVRLRDVLKEELHAAELLLERSL